jgi:hypothetical protein
MTPIEHAGAQTSEAGHVQPTTGNAVGISGPDHTGGAAARRPRIARACPGVILGPKSETISQEWARLAAGSNGLEPCGYIDDVEVPCVRMIGAWASPEGIITNRIHGHHGLHELVPLADEANSGVIMAPAFDPHDRPCGQFDSGSDAFGQ